MKFLVTLSDFLVPTVMFLIVVYGLIHKVDVFQSFVDGAKEGINVVLSILPTLVALMLGIAMLRTSGALDGLVRLLSPLVSFSNFPTEVIPVALMRTVSSSASPVHSSAVSSVPVSSSDFFSEASSSVISASSSVTVSAASFSSSGSFSFNALISSSRAAISVYNVLIAVICVRNSVVSSLCAS